MTNPKSVYDKSKLFTWSSPADKEANPWRVPSYKKNAEQFIANISGESDVVVDSHPRVGGYEVMWVNLADNRKREEYEPRLEKLAKKLKSLKFKIKKTKDEILLIDDIKRDFLRNGSIEAIVSMELAKTASSLVEGHFVGDVVFDMINVSKRLTAGKKLPKELVDYLVHKGNQYNRLKKDSEKVFTNEKEAKDWIEKQIKSKSPLLKQWISEYIQSASL